MAEIGRRQFLTLFAASTLGPLLGALSPSRNRPAWAVADARQSSYAVDVGILYGALRYSLGGVIEETVDRARGRYQVKIVGEGKGIANRIDSHGWLVDGRWAPLRSASWFMVRGRESRSELVYDYDRRSVEYHFRGETFFLRRLRRADDVVAVPEGTHVDDVVSAMLNYADDVWPAEPDGTRRTWVVRRRRSDQEGPDDVQPFYRAELAPFTIKPDRDPATGKATADFDLTRFSSWARRDEPARIVFGADRRPESIVSPLILGTTITIRFAAR